MTQKSWALSLCDDDDDDDDDEWRRWRDGDLLLAAQASMHKAQQRMEYRYQSPSCLIVHMVPQKNANLQERLKQPEKRTNCPECLC